MAGRLSSLLEVLRPRTLARTVKSVDDLTAAARDLRRLVKGLEDRLAQSDDRLAGLGRELRTVKESLADVTLRESRLRAIYQRDVAERPLLATLDRLLDAQAIRQHIDRAFDAAVLHLDPFPHVVVENLLPRSFYDAVIRGIPPVELFDGSQNKQRIVVPFEMAPAYSREVWGFLIDHVIDAMLGPALVRTFKEAMDAWLETQWPTLGPRPTDTMQLHSTDGRILLRGRGYVIPPHRDPKWGFVTCLLYLARPGDSPEWGTQLYAVGEDSEAMSVAPHWIAASRCTPARDVPFRANTALAFLNSAGAHGASIPADAEPADLQRYIYQFRVGPTADTIRRLQALLPAERRDRWSGKVVDYA